MEELVVAIFFAKLRPLAKRNKVQCLVYEAGYRMPKYFNTGYTCVAVGTEVGLDCRWVVLKECLAYFRNGSYFFKKGLDMGADEVTRLLYSVTKELEHILPKGKKSRLRSVLK